MPSECGPELFDFTYVEGRAVSHLSMVAGSSRPLTQSTPTLPSAAAQLGQRRPSHAISTSHHQVFSLDRTRHKSSVKSIQIVARARVSNRKMQKIIRRHEWQVRGPIA